MNADRLNELAHGLALGELGLAEESEFLTMLSASSEEQRRALSHLFDAAGLATLGMPIELPPTALKDKILGSILKQTASNSEPVRKPGLHYVYGDDTEGWQPMPVGGAFVKPLSMDHEKGFAVVLGKLSPGASYPPHTHVGPEDVYILAGDLTIGTTRLKAGDFHHADAGSKHGINFSETGCTVLVVLTIQDLQDQYAAAEAMARQ